MNVAKGKRAWRNTFEGSVAANTEQRTFFLFLSTRSSAVEEERQNGVSLFNERDFKPRQRVPRDLDGRDGTRVPRRRSEVEPRRYNGNVIYDHVPKVPTAARSSRTPAIGLENFATPSPFIVIGPLYSSYGDGATTAFPVRTACCTFIYKT